jgi:hypothetical protein
MYSGNDGHASQRARIESQSHRDAGQPAHRSQPDDPGAPAKALTMSVALGGNLPPIVAKRIHRLSASQEEAPHDGEASSGAINRRPMH